MKLLMRSIILPISILIFIFSCSYERFNSPNQKKFHIIDVGVEGEKRSAFLVRKKINRFSNIDSKNKIKLDISLNSNKEIEEKSIQNKVTKYKLFMTAQVEITDLASGKKYKRTYKASQSYNVEDRYSNTVNNSKKANNNLIKIITEEILDQLKIFYN